MATVLKAGAIKIDLEANAAPLIAGFKKAIQSLDSFGKSTNKQTSQSKRLDDQLKSLERRKELLTTKMKALKDAGNKNTTAYQNLSNQLANTNDKISTQNIRITEYEKKANKATFQTKLLADAKKHLSSTLQTLTKVGIGGMVAGLAGLAGFTIMSIKTAGDFQTQMLEVKAISNATGEEYKSLTKQSKDLGRTTAFTAKQVAEAQKYQAMAGYSVNQILQATPSLLALAAAGNIDLATTSDIVTDAMTAFGMKAEETTKFADLLAQTSRSSNTDIALMGETFKYAAPLAGTFGVAAEDVALALGLMASAGIKGSMAGTALRKGFSKLAKPTKEASEAMSKLGVKAFDARGEMKPFGDILVDLRTRFSKLTPQMQASSAKAMFGENAFAGWLAVINASPEAFDKLRHATLNYDGVAQQMADTMQSGWQGAINRMQSAWEGLLISFGESGMLDLVTIAFEKLSTVLTILGGKVETWLKPRMEALMESLRVWYNSGGKEAIKSFLNEAWNVFVDSIKWFVRDVWPQLKQALGNFMDWMRSEEGKQAMRDTANLVRGIGDALGWIIDQAGRAVNALKGVSDRWQSYQSTGKLPDTGVSWRDGLFAKAIGQGRANGGLVNPGQLYEVGENNKAEMLMMNGRQFMIPGNKGEVLNQDQLDKKGRTASNKTINVYNYNQGQGASRFFENYEFAV